MHTLCHTLPLPMYGNNGTYHALPTSAHPRTPTLKHASGVWTRLDTACVQCTIPRLALNKKIRPQKTRDQANNTARLRGEGGERRHKCFVPATELRPFSHKHRLRAVCTIP